jgi:hypothetical protein
MTENVRCVESLVIARFVKENKQRSMVIANHSFIENVIELKIKRVD